jgi:hypothetical protein
MEPAVPEAVDVTVPTAPPPFVVTVPTASFAVPTASFAVDVTVPYGSSTADCRGRDDVRPVQKLACLRGNGPRQQDSESPRGRLDAYATYAAPTPQTSPQPHGLHAACVDYHAGKDIKTVKRTVVRQRVLCRRYVASRRSRFDPGTLHSRARVVHRDEVFSVAAGRSIYSCRARRSSATASVVSPSGRQASRVRKSDGRNRVPGDM